MPGRCTSSALRNAAADLLPLTSEHEEQADKRLEEYHKKAAQGGFRTKRRGGIGIDHSDSEDDDTGRPRPSKRPRKNNDNIAALREWAEC